MDGHRTIIPSFVASRSAALLQVLLRKNHADHLATPSDHSMAPRAHRVTLGRLTTVVDGPNSAVFNDSTSNGANINLIQSCAGLGPQRGLGYDALNRLVQTIDNYNGTN